MVNREEFKQDSLKTMTDAAIDDYHDGVDEHNIKLLDESYQFSMFEKENLLSRFDMGMYDFINKIYGDSYDRELNKSWRTNDSVSLVQNYLNSIGHSNIKEDGFYGEDTKKAFKDYLYEHSATHMWESMKSGVEKMWNPDE